MFKRIWMNLKTTLAGASAGGALIVSGSKEKNVEQILTGIFIVVAGLLKKDEMVIPVKNGVTEPNK